MQRREFLSLVPLHALPSSLSESDKYAVVFRNLDPKRAGGMGLSIADRTGDSLCGRYPPGLWRSYQAVIFYLATCEPLWHKTFINQQPPLAGTFYCWDLDEER